VLPIRTAAKRELGFTIRIERDFLCLQTPRLDIMVNAMRNDARSKFNIYQADATIFLYRFLGINLEEGTSCYNLYRDMRANANSLRLMAEHRNKRQKWGKSQK